MPNQIENTGKSTQCFLGDIWSPLMRMLRVNHWVLFTVLFTAAILFAPAQSEAKQRYLILKTPAAATRAQPSVQHYPANRTVVSGDAYSYGYFGAAPRRHWSRHGGYYNSYTQWSGR
ncbi:MAG: hypothetical protein ACI9HK_002376 [Pirellulaceae bacterium]|jgi:hypothetical protein